MTTAIDHNPNTSVNRAPVPDPREKVWVVIVADFRESLDDDENDIMILTPLYALNPKGGGPASVYDSATWGDRSMARQRANMVADKLRKERRSVSIMQAVRIGFVDGEKLFWSDGERMHGERVEKRIES